MAGRGATSLDVTYGRWNVLASCLAMNVASFMAGSASIGSRRKFCAIVLTLSPLICGLLESTCDITELGSVRVTSTLPVANLFLNHRQAIPTPRICSALSTVLS